MMDNGKGNGKSVPLQARRGPEGSRKLRFPDFVTTAQDGGKAVSLTHRPPLPPENTPGTQSETCRVLYQINFRNSAFR